MNSSENNLENLVSAKLTWAARIHHWEGDISEAIYRMKEKGKTKFVCISYQNRLSSNIKSDFP
jgi:hypothetical protein